LRRRITGENYLGLSDLRRAKLTRHEDDRWAIAKAAMAKPNGYGAGAWGETTSDQKFWLSPMTARDITLELGTDALLCGLFPSGGIRSGSSDADN
jgi:hypothetical protein